MRSMMRWNVQLHRVRLALIDQTSPSTDHRRECDISLPLEQQTWTAVSAGAPEELLALHFDCGGGSLVLILTRILVIPGKEGEFARIRTQHRATGKDGFLNEIVTKVGISVMPEALRSPPPCEAFVSYLCLAMWTSEACFVASIPTSTRDLAFEAADPVRIVVDLG